MCVLIFSTTLFWNISHSKKNWQRYDQKCILVFMQSTRYSCPILIRIGFSRQILWKSWNTKFCENPSCVCQVVSSERTHWQTDGRTDTKKLMIAPCKFAKAPKINFPLKSVSCNASNCCRNFMDAFHYTSVYPFLKYTFPQSPCT